MINTNINKNEKVMLLIIIVAFILIQTQAPIVMFPYTEINPVQGAGDRLLPFCCHQRYWHTD